MSQELTKICNELTQREFPENYRSCMQAAATLIDRASECLPTPQMNRTVAALHLISTKIDDLASTVDAQIQRERPGGSREFNK